jgi:hypothetical protein
MEAMEAVGGSRTVAAVRIVTGSARRAVKGLGVTRADTLTTKTNKVRAARPRAIVVELDIFT